MDMTVARPHDRWPLRLVALLLAVAAVFWLRKTGAHWRSVSALLPLSCLACASVAFGIAAARLRDGPVLARTCAALLFVMRLAVLFVALPELVASRLPVRWDAVLGLVPPKAECPIYYRMPDAVFDDGTFLKRTGPDSWTGKPLSSVLRMKRSRDTAYTDEEPFTVRYDADGFRNSPGLADWDALVAGDSFVELGSLPDGETITDQLAAGTGLRVKNLGVASTGPMNHAAFLRHFGRAPSSRHAMLVWSEVALEKTAEESAGLRDGRSSAPAQTDNSLLRAMWGRLRAELRKDGGTRQYANATFAGSVPVMLDPPTPDAPTHARLESLRLALHEWAQTARGMKMEPWLVFIPAKIRVWQGHLSGPAELIHWKPNTLPDLMQKLCRDSGIHWVDTTAAMKEASQRGVLVFNPVVDGHPTKAGAEIIAQTAAKALRAASADH